MIWNDPDNEHGDGCESCTGAAWGEPPMCISVVIAEILLALGICVLECMGSSHVGLLCACNTEICDSRVGTGPGKWVCLVSQHSFTSPSRMGSGAELPLQSLT